MEKNIAEKTQNRKAGLGVVEIISRSYGAVFAGAKLTERVYDGSLVWNPLFRAQHRKGPDYDYFSNLHRGVYRCFNLSALAFAGA